jgi:hypothetical protein
MSLRSLLVDVHSHLYLPRYASLLRSRSNVPQIFTRNTPSGQSEDRLLILGDERSGGRPVGPQVRRYRLSDLQSYVPYEENIDSTGTEMRSLNSWTSMELIFRSSGTVTSVLSQLSLPDMTFCITAPRTLG